MQGRLLKSSICFFALLCWLGAARCVGAQQSVDTLVMTTLGGARPNLATNTFDATGAIKNISPTVTLLGPMQLVLTSVSDPSVTLANTAGSTADGLPYLNVPLPNNVLTPGQSVNDLIKFYNPKKIAFTYQFSVRAALTGTPAGAAPSIYITSPANGSEFKTLTVNVSGTVDNNQARVSVNGVNATVTNGYFTALNVPLTHDGAQILTAIAADSVGNTGQASTTVIRDTTPPMLAIDSPKSGFQTSDATIAIAGTVSDVVAVNPVVMVNGVPATVNNNSFIVMNLPLQIGPNTFTATATDDVGNTSSTQITVTRVATASFMLSIMGGQAQTALVNTTLPQPLVVKFTDGAGNALAGRELIFQVSRGDGTLLSGGKTGRKLYLVTDANGMAAANFTLGSRTGAGNNRVQAMLEGAIPLVEFCATSYSGTPNNILPTPCYAQQIGVVNRPLASPFFANVFDTAGNPVPGAPVTFTVTAGGGSLGGQTSLVAMTDMNGVASAVLTLGPKTGTLNNIVTATFAGQTAPPLPFSASGRIAGAPGNTTFHGMVLDNLDKPLVNAHVFFPGMSGDTYTDGQGKFALANVTPGGQKIVIDSSTIQDAKGLKYNGVELNTNIVSGVDNSLMTPVYLPPMPTDPQFSATITGTVTTPVVIPMPDVPEMTLTLLPGTVVSNADGPASPTNPITITQSRVNNNRVPMTLPNGATFLLAGAVAPHGVSFNPPAAIAVPNTGLAPGTITDIYNFDHSVGRYVSIGLATVTADGSHVVSNPGFGIPTTGWHGFSPFVTRPTTAKSCSILSLTTDPPDIHLNGPVLPAGQTITFTANVSPPGAKVTFSGDMGSIISQSGNSFTTRYYPGGLKTITATCGQSHQSIQIEVIQKVSIWVNAFIPYKCFGPLRLCPIGLIPLVNCIRIFGQSTNLLQYYGFSGDDRSFSADPQASSRIHHQVTYDFNTGLVTEQKKIDVSHICVYDKGKDMGKIVCSDRGTDAGLTYTFAINTRSFAVTFDDDAKDPFFKVVGFNPAPSIHIHEQISFDTSTRTIVLTGSHRGFPSHETYISINDGPGIELHRSEAGPEAIWWLNILKLFGPPNFVDVDANYSGRF